MSALFAVSSTHVGRRRKFGEVSSTECTGEDNDFELIPMVTNSSAVADKPVRRTAAQLTA